MITYAPIEEKKEKDSGKKTHKFMFYFPPSASVLPGFAGKLTETEVFFLPIKRRPTRLYTVATGSITADKYNVIQ